MTNKVTPQSEQDRLLELQLAAAPKSRKQDILTILLSLAFIYILTALFFILPDSEFSEQENRYLQQAPEIQSKLDASLIERIANGKFLDRLVSGKYISEIADYYADQFPARDIFVGLKAVCEVAQLKGGNNNIVICKNGYIIKRDDHPDLDTVSSNLSYVAAFSQKLTASSVPVYLAMAGRPADALERYLPALFPYDRSEALWSFFRDQVSGCDALTFIDLLTPLKNSINASDEQYYYRTDHHWTTLGAYTAYTEIMRTLGDEARPLSDFRTEFASDSFYGTTWSSAGMKWIAPDEIQYFRFDGDDSDYITMIVDTGVSFNGFYDRTYLDKKDKYSSFIGGNNARVDISSTNNGEREKLLVIKDSFAHSLAPFLAYHYDLILIDPRYYKNSLTDLIENEGVDKVLFLNYIGSITDSDIYGMLNLSAD